MSLDMREEFQKANKKFLNGDGITDPELSTLLLFYKNILELADMLDRDFNLYVSELRRRLYTLEGFKRARDEWDNKGTLLT